MNDALTDGGTGHTPVHPDDLEGLLHGWVSTQGELDELERRNVLEGRRWIDGVRRPVDVVLDDTFLRTLHRRAFGSVWSWAGNYRTRATSIGVDAHEIAVRTRDLMLDAREWFAAARNDDERREALARLHHQVVLIHPFANGNGRVARLHADVVARAANVPTPTWSIGATAPRASYLAALRAADEGDIEPLVRFMWS